MDLAKGFSLVTGSSSGIGRAIALRLAADGYPVLVHFHRNEKGAQETGDQIHRQGGRAELIRFDVADGTAVEAALDGFFQSHPEEKLDILVNNAGFHQDTLLGMMSNEAFDSVLKTNTYGAFYTMRWCVKMMLRQRQGTIVNIASLAGQTGNAGQVNYAASKAALIAMTRSLALEVGCRGIRVNAVAPGLIETDMLETVPETETLKKKIPLGRFGSPQEVAGAVSFLCSKDAGYVTGTTLSVNGGLFPG